MTRRGGSRMMPAGRRNEDRMLGRRGMLAAAAGLGLATAGRARAQGAWPERPLRWIVGYPPGGASDLMARLSGAHIAARLGQPVVVENRPGGGAVLASELVARSAPDGYTMLHVDNGILVYNPALYARLPYDPDRDLTGVGFIGRFPLFLVVRPDSPLSTLTEYVSVAKRQAPTYGTPAVASPHHLAMEMLKRRLGFDATHVPYRGGPAAMNDLLAGQVDSVLIDISTGLPFITSARVRALCVLSETRSERAPEVPTARELGHANAIAYGWQGMSVPAATPGPVIARLNEELVRAIAQDDLRTRMRDFGIETAPWSPDEFNAFVARESAEWRPLIRELGIRLDG
jgi:tripartite-type tricarboxylate transporter receptor subunit TctC